MTYLRIFHNARHVGLDSVRDAEVDQLQRRVDYDKICRLQVAVDDTCRERT